MAAEPAMPGLVREPLIPTLSRKCSNSFAVIAGLDPAIVTGGGAAPSSGTRGSSLRVREKGG
jgi:hypothetical protein